MKKRIYAALSLSLLVSGIGVASNGSMLNTISYQITEQQWVKTSKATAEITINATDSDQNIAKIRQDILSNLQKILAGNWHLTQFSRSKTSSGLESVQVVAQIRLPSEQLNQIYQRVKGVSHAGQTYTVSSLNFNPDLSDIENAQSSLRKKLYVDVQDELKQLNQQFPNQNYFVHQIQFVSSQSVMPRALSLVKTAGNVSVPTVSQQLTLTAQVELSSKLNSGDSND